MELNVFSGSVEQVQEPVHNLVLADVALEEPGVIGGAGRSEGGDHVFHPGFMAICARPLQPFFLLFHLCNLRNLRVDSLARRQVFEAEHHICSSR